MSYFATAHGCIEIPKNNVSSLCLSVRMMLSDTMAMGESPVVNGIKTNNWYKWVDTDALKASCRNEDIVKLFNCWGFFVVKGSVEGIYDVNFDNKLGDEDKFIKKIAQFITKGEINGRGEDGACWKHEFKKGVMKITYKTVELI